MRDWARYWRSPDLPLEAMRAHFERHVYHRHSHQTYSFGVTEDGAQTFTCRGARHTSAGGMVMAFNPDDPHDGHAADRLGFTYRMVHIGPVLVADVLADAAEHPVGLPLFAAPVTARPEPAARLRALGTALLDGAPALRRDELLAEAVLAVVRYGAATPPRPPARVTSPDARRLAAHARDLLNAGAHGMEVTAGDLAAATGRSRFTVYRAFQATYGMAPSDYQRQLRLRAARDMLDRGRPVAEVAAAVGFADQSHLTRWFARYFGITPGTYQRATA